MAACPSPRLILPPQRDDLRSADGVILARDRWGPPTAAADVVFAHGFGQTRGAWSASAARLAEAGYVSLTLDARGHGDSGRNPADRPYRMEQLIDDLIASAGAEPAPCVLVGASMGGLLGIAAQHLARPFRALVLVDIAPRWDAGGVGRILDFMGAHPHGFASLDEAATRIAAYLPHRPRKSDDALRAVLRQAADGRWHWHWDPRLLDDVGRAGDGYQDALEAAARSIRIPTLLISGGRSELIGDHHVEQFLQLVPHAEHRRIDDATHMVVGDRNDLFTDSILDFLSTVAAPATVVHGVSP